MSKAEEFLESNKFNDLEFSVRICVTLEHAKIACRTWTKNLQSELETLMKS